MIFLAAIALIGLAAAVFLPSKAPPQPVSDAPGSPVLGEEKWAPMLEGKGAP